MTTDAITCNQSATGATPFLQQSTMVDSEIRNAAVPRMWTPERVLHLLREVAIDGVCSYQVAYRRAHSLPSMARKMFGSFATACSAAGLQSANEARPKFVICAVPDCGAIVRSSGNKYCEMHYARIRRNGHTELLTVPELRLHTYGYLMIYAPAHPLAKRQGRCREYQHRVVYYDQYGEGPFPCHWCNKTVTWSTMHVDHVNDIKQDNRIENLVASCPKCNTWRNKEKNLRALRMTVGRHVTLAGETKTISEWARHVGISSSAMSFRVDRGWPLEMALTKPRGAQGPLAARA